MLHKGNCSLYLETEGTENQDILKQCCFLLIKHMAGKQRCYSKPRVSYNTYTLLLLYSHIVDKLLFFRSGTAVQINCRETEVFVKSGLGEHGRTNPAPCTCTEPTGPLLFSVMTHAQGEREVD